MVDKNVILIVDDTPVNVSLLHDLLKDSYRTKVAVNGTKALELATAHPKPDLILLDVMMPDLSGYDVCAQLKARPETADIPVVFLTALSDGDDEYKGLALGAVDYITKPVNPPILLTRVKNHIALRSAHLQLTRYNEDLEARVQARTDEVTKLRDATIVAMGSLAETRDNETGNHIIRTKEYVRVLAEHLQRHPRFRHELTAENITQLYKSAPLHDIGKVGIPDSILLKAGALTDDEFTIMKTHAALGKKAIEDAMGAMTGCEAFLRYAAEIAYGHHERWDGSGYPQGLAGDDIPISARLMALADVYDALISKRCYKPAFSHEKAASLIRKGCGGHFDPDVVDAFFELEQTFIKIANTYKDDD